MAKREKVTDGHRNIQRWLLFTVGMDETRKISNKYSRCLAAYKDLIIKVKIDSNKERRNKSIPRLTFGKLV